MTSSEDVSGLMQRGVYSTDAKQHLLAAYDNENQVGEVRTVWDGKR